MPSARSPAPQSRRLLWSYSGRRDGSGEDSPECGAVLDFAQTRPVRGETSGEAGPGGHPWQPCAELGEGV